MSRATEFAMNFWSPVQKGHLIQRYKRFFADIQLENHEIITAHCVNTGIMMGLTHPGATVWVCPKKAESKGKLQYVWMMEQLQEAGSQVLVGTNTSIPSIIFKEALMQNQLFQWSNTASFRSEPRLGASRLDFLLARQDGTPVWIELKNVHLKIGNTALFPDCVTQRGAKHLALLSQLAQEGHEAAMVYVVQREDCHAFQIAGYLDPEYGKAFELAQAAGVRMFAYGCHLSMEGITLIPECLPVKGVCWDPEQAEL